MTIKKTLLLTLVVLTQSLLYGQIYSSASTGAEIIVPVGTEKTGEMITGSFYPGKERSTVEFSSKGILVDGKNFFTAAEKAVVPVFHVISSQQAYSITYSFDPYIKNQNKQEETIRIESINILPIADSKAGKSLPDQFTIGARLAVAPYQHPGQYTAGNPYTITVHFN